MASRQLIVELIGDDASLNKALGRSTSGASLFGGTLKTLAKVAAGVFAGRELINGIEDVTKAALSAQAAQVRLAAVFKAAGLSATKYAGQINTAEEAGRKLGFTNQDTEQGLGSLVTATGSVTKSMSDLAVAQDLARFKGISLVDATKSITTAMAGSQRAAHQLGITVIPLTTNVDALKASHENLTTAIGKADLAQAKLADKMATGQAVIDQVSAKVKGQADAYSQTAAGGMAQFQAGLENLEAEVGAKLLPVMTQLLDWVNTNWPEISAVIDQVCADIKAVFDNVLIPAFNTVEPLIARMVDYVRANWPQISATVKTVMDDVKTVITTVADAVSAFWKSWGSTIITIVKAAFDQVEAVIKGVVQVIEGVFDLIDGLIHGRWSQIWQGLSEIVDGVFTGIVGTIRGMVTIAGAAAGKFATAIYDGMIDVFKGFGQALIGLIIGPINAMIDAIDALKIDVPSIKIPYVGTVGGGSYGFNIPEIAVPKLAAGGIVSRATLAMVGERGPEAIVPLSRAGGFGGGTQINVSFPNYVGSKQELIQVVQQGLIQLGRRNPRIFTGTGVTV